MYGRFLVRSLNYVGGTAVLVGIASQVQERRKLNLLWGRPSTSTHQEISFEQQHPHHSQPNNTGTWAHSKQPPDTGKVSACNGSSCPGRIADAANRVLPSVVAIRTELDLPSRSRFPIPGREDMTRILVSMGSGFVINKEGLILTNAHVVSSVTEGGRMTVETHDGHVYHATLHSMDPWSDFAIVKVTERVHHHHHSTDSQAHIKWQPVTIGSSADLKLGQWLFTFGHPIGLGHSLTSGIVSCLNRHNADLDMSGKMDNRTHYIQTNFNGMDHGNSGGAVFNLNGEVVGINIIKAETDGIGFAVNIENAIPIVDQLLRHQKVIRPFMGIRMLTLTDSVVEQIVTVLDEAEDEHKNPHAEMRTGPTNSWLQWAAELTFWTRSSQATAQATSGDDAETRLMCAIRSGVDQGVLVFSVFEDSPADRAKCLAGDVITQVNGHPVFSAKEVYENIGFKVDEPIVLTVKRCMFDKNGQAEVGTVEIRIKPEELDVFEGARAPLNLGDHEATYNAYLAKLDQKRRDKLRFLEK